MDEFIDLAGLSQFGPEREGALAGPTGLFFILLIAAALIFLIRNMNKHLRKIPDRFPAERRGPGIHDDTIAEHGTDQPGGTGPDAR